MTYENLYITVDIETQDRERDKMKNIYKSILVAVVFGNVIAFPVVAYNFPWNTYLIDPTPYYILQSESLGFLIAACIFFYEWAKYAEHPRLDNLKRLINKTVSKRK